ncbi:MAG: hypothetical protein RL461_1118, partial [Planctomycetota bacterium]
MRRTDLHALVRALLLTVAMAAVGAERSALGQG